MENRANSRPLAPSDLAAVLGDWSAGPGPRFRRLARAVAAAVERGALAPGTRLPAERPLAAGLALGRGTVVAAYDLLVGEGVVVRRVGSGTYVADLAQPALPEGREGPGLVGRLTEDPRPDLVDLSLSVVPDAADLPPATVGTGDLTGTGYGPWGRPALRAMVAELLTGWGLPTDPAQVVVTTGAQQAIALTAACWVRPGDAVVVDEPSYPGAPAAYRAAGARLVPLPVDGATPPPAALAAALASTPALVYLQPTVQSPTGAVAGPGRRRALAEVLGPARVPVVEDLSLAGLAWRSFPPPLAATLPTAHPAAVVGSLSKLLWGGLRLGFLRAPAPLAARLARLKATADLGTSVASQVLAERWLAHPDLLAALERRRRDLRRRQAALVADLAARLPDWRVEAPEGGLSVWVTLPAPVAPRLAEVGLRHGVAVASGPALGGSAASAAGLRLSFAPDRASLALGVERLAAAWAEVGG